MKVLLGAGTGSGAGDVHWVPNILFPEALGTASRARVFFNKKPNANTNSNHQDLTRPRILGRRISMFLSIFCWFSMSVCFLYVSFRVSFPPWQLLLNMRMTHTYSESSV